MNALFQRPLGPISIILNFPKKFLVKAEIKQLSPKENLRSFDQNWRNTRHICTRWIDSTPLPPGYFRAASSRALHPKGTSDHVTCLKPRKNYMLCYLCQNRAAWWRLIKRLYYHSSLTFEYYKWQELSHTLQSSPSTNSVQQFGIATKRRNLARTHEN